ncbi:alpha/beta fold hydrolase [Nocardioides jejuensis]|uniref:Alpha/beta hydrolase n=1 Tax=Nocardioides jejuensis TaxID=2502782 RepID=A0A4R1C2C8_9ACTN|nr:alpha/beta hydrolase [Nocardioides jejuensis]TCJ23885.1 alpha/beta hydrolase [Nocardioides jejuensis]
MLSHEIHGSGAPLVLLHGLTHRRQAWYPVLEHLTDHRTVVLLDLPGHGDSPDLVVRDGDVQGAIRGELEQTLDALGLDRPHIAGNSLGGRIALEAAADGIVASATGLSPAAFWWGSADFVYIRSVFTWLTTSARLMAPVVPTLARSPHARRVMGTMVSTRSDLIPHEEFVADLRGMRRAIPAMKQIFPAAEPFTGRIPSDVPVTIAWGEHDRILLGYQAAIARRRMPHARHVLLEGCGHVPMADDPAQIAAVLLAGSASVSPDVATA